MNLASCDLVVDEIYRGPRLGNALDDPLPELLGVSRGGGFRYIGDRSTLSGLNLVVLKTAFNDPDWPDHLDHESGLFTYYGDNKKPGRMLHNTPRGGNLILSHLFSGRHDASVTEHFPVILLFGSAGEYRDVRFLGLAVPGSADLGPDDDLVAIWRTAANGARFQNYRSVFTVLDVNRISRKWLCDIQQGKGPQSPHAPRAWLDWLHHRHYKPLVAPHSIEIRTREQQLPEDKEGKAILNLIYNTFKEDSYAFEACSVELAKLMMPTIHSVDLTRPWRDNGRDAVGLYRIGEGLSAIDVEFSLEAKRYKPGKGVGIDGLSRLISRLRHRQFGILVTTSYLASQAYKELKEDGHPVVILCGADIAKLLKQKIGSVQQVRQWLEPISHNGN